MVGPLREVFLRAMHGGPFWRNFLRVMHGGPFEGIFLRVMHSGPLWGKFLKYIYLTIAPPLGAHVHTTKFRILIQTVLKISLCKRKQDLNNIQGVSLSFIDLLLSYLKFSSAPMSPSPKVGDLISTPLRRP